MVVDGSPAALQRLLELKTPVARVRYRFRQVAGTPLGERVDTFLGSWSRHSATPR